MSKWPMEKYESSFTGFLDGYDSEMKVKAKEDANTVAFLEKLIIKIEASAHKRELLWLKALENLSKNIEKQDKIIARLKKQLEVKKR